VREMLASLVIVSTTDHNRRRAERLPQVIDKTSTRYSRVATQATQDIASFTECFKNLIEIYTVGPISISFCFVPPT